MESAATTVTYTQPRLVAVCTVLRVLHGRYPSHREVVNLTRLLFGRDYKQRLE